MKGTITSIFFLFAVASYAQTSKKDYATLNIPETPIFADSDTLRAASLDDIDFLRLVTLAEKCIQKWNEEQPVKYTDGKVHDRKLDDYYLQYLPVYNLEGEKLVWINFIKKSDVTEIPHQMFVSADNPHYFNCWVNVSKVMVVK